jgi:tetratricopeptide (TPR) repeat protein
VNGTNRPSMLDRLQEYLKADPDNWNLRAELFDAALAAGEPEIARAQVEHALKAQPDDAAWKHREATLLLATRQYAQAQRVLEDLIALGQDAPAIRYNLAYALFAQGRLEEASAVVAPLRSGDDDVGGVAWVLWLRCQHRLEQHDEALAAFGAAAAARPLPPDAWGAASLMAFDASHLADARTWADRALQGRPDQLEALATRGSLALGTQDVAGATAAFEAALRVHPTDGRSWSGVAFTRMLALDLPGAIAAFEKAVATMPDHIGTWIGYGWAQVLSNQPQAALASFEQALRLDRNVPESHGALAVALARLGQADRAQAEVEVALRLDPHNLSARFAQATLRGEASDPAAFLRIARGVLSKIPAGGASGRTLADVVFKEQE